MRLLPGDKVRILVGADLGSTGTVGRPGYNQGTFIVYLDGHDDEGFVYRADELEKL
jgi:hypothetical protein